MSLLDGLFDQAELVISDALVTGSGTITIGHLYKVRGSDTSITLALAAVPLVNAVGRRFAVKVVEDAPTPPGDVLIVTVPLGMEIEGSDGSRGPEAWLSMGRGEYHEWMCDAAGAWLRLIGLSSGGGGEGGGSVTLAGAGMTKAGDTLNVVAGDASIVVGPDSLRVGALATDGQHGTRGGGAALHPDASNVLSGFATPAMVTKLAGIAPNADATLATLAAATVPINVNGQRIANAGAPVNPTDVATKAYADSAGGGGSPSLPIDAGSERIINVGAPVSPSDAATKAYADALVQGLDVKASCEVLTDVDVTLTGLGIVDEVQLAAGDRVLVKGQTDLTQNGIYVASASVWTRAPDADSPGEVSNGMFTFVTGGASWFGSGWVMVTYGDPVTLGTTPLFFHQFSAPGVTEPGDGLMRQSGQILAVKPNVDGSIAVDAEGVRVGALTDVHHGDRGGGTLHPPASLAENGFMTIADKQALTNASLSQSAVVAGPATQGAAVGQLVLCDVTAGSITVNLPAVHARGNRIGVKMVSPAVDGNDVEIAASAGQFIDGSGVIELESDHGCVILESSGVGWMRVAFQPEAASTPPRRDLPVWPEVIVADATIAPNYTYEVETSAGDVTLTISGWNADSIGFAVKGVSLSSEVGLIIIDSAGWPIERPDGEVDAGPFDIGWASNQQYEEWFFDGATLWRRGSHLEFDSPMSINDTGNVMGTNGRYAQADHGHYHGSLIGDTLHAPATVSLAGFATPAMVTAINASTAKLATLAAGQPATVGRLTVDVILQVPTALAYAASITLDAAIKNDHAVSGVLTGPLAVAWSNAAAGRSGTLAVRQDATGGRVVTFTAPGGWTIYRDPNSDLVASPIANAVTVFTWMFVAVGGLNMLLINKQLAVV